MALSRIATLKASRNRNPPIEAEQAGLDFEAQRSFGTAVNLLVALNKQGGVRAHRRLVFNACIRAMTEANSADPASLYEAAVRAREQNWQIGRAVASGARSRSRGLRRKSP